MKAGMLTSVTVAVVLMFALSLFGEMLSLAPFSPPTLGHLLENESSEPIAPVRNRKIAIVSGFVSRPLPNRRAQPRIDDSLMDHMLNKVCYAHLWGYEFIFNTTWGFDKNTTGRHWLEYGTWHRVPHMLAAMDRGYEWILYADTDFVIQDIGLPLESFFKEWELYGKNNVQVFVPTDGFPFFTFSAFAVLIRNSPFGRRVLENWMELANGLCPNGNFQSAPGEYSWTDSDQPGLWYALAKTHSEFFAPPRKKFKVTCNKTTGLIRTNRLLGPELNKYFRRMGGKRGDSHQALTRVPENQPILWSTSDEDGRGGLGVQQTFGNFSSVDKKQWFALHRKESLTDDMLADLTMCRKTQGCFAHYTKNGEFVHGCQHPINSESSVASAR